MKFLLFLVAAAMCAGATAGGGVLGAIVCGAFMTAFGLALIWADRR